MYWFFETPLTIFLMVASIAITAIAQAFVSTSYSKYKKIRNTKGITGAQMAREILDKHGLSNIYVVETKGMLSDHYDPKRKVVRLSNDIYNGETVAAVAVAAHEVGHALQDKDGYYFMKIRSFLVPIVNIGTNLGYFALVIGFFLGTPELSMWGMILLFLAVLFQLVTLPVEFNASKRAKEELKQFSYFNTNEQSGASKMLTAAAMTYVASLITTILELLRLFLIYGDRDN